MSKAVAGTLCFPLFRTTFAKRAFRRVPMNRQTEVHLTGHFQAILDALSDGVYISDVTGKTLCVNRL